MFFSPIKPVPRSPNRAISSSAPPYITSVRRCFCETYSLICWTMSHLLSRQHLWVQRDGALAHLATGAHGVLDQMYSHPVARTILQYRLPFGYKKFILAKAVEMKDRGLREEDLLARILAARDVIRTSPAMLQRMRDTLATLSCLHQRWGTPLLTSPIPHCFSLEAITSSSNHLNWLVFAEMGLAGDSVIHGRATELLPDPCVPEGTLSYYLCQKNGLMADYFIYTLVVTRGSTQSGHYLIHLQKVGCTRLHRRCCIPTQLRSKPGHLWIPGTRSQESAQNNVSSLVIELRSVQCRPQITCTSIAYTNVNTGSEWVKIWNYFPSIVTNFTGSMTLSARIKIAHFVVNSPLWTRIGPRCTLPANKTSVPAETTLRYTQYYERTKRTFRSLRPAESLANICTSESHRMVLPLVSGFSWGSPVFSAIAFRGCSISTSLYPRRISRPYREKEVVSDLLHALQRLELAVREAAHEPHIAPGAGAWVLLRRQVQQPHAVEGHARHHARERPLDTLFRVVPLAAQLDLRLAVEHRQLVACTRLHRSHTQAPVKHKYPPPPLHHPRHPVLRAGIKGRGKREIPEKTPPTNGITQHSSHMRKSGATRPGIEPASP
ncbi:hypothetical protein PR048_003646 [Dryococelus australis]|uniref:Uncharacterized protein n=1 Tax=Dryococelus australis TaxID=614101 RepID=A0ABQ9INQ3_9NEOP|nr:hypothetical protein PR048_003646 [Dryococelus australis]